MDNLKIEITHFFSFNENTRIWHIPLMSALCMGISLCLGLYLDNLSAGLLAGMGGMMALYYIPSLPIVNRIQVVVFCSFLFLICTTMGVLFSFNPIISSFILAFLAFGIQWLKLTFKVKSPGSFFFVMITSLVSCMPYNRAQIPVKVGIVTLGLILTLLIILVYALLPQKEKVSEENSVFHLPRAKENYDNVREAIIFGLFVGSALLFAHSVGLYNPYWVPISCSAVMQGTSKGHIGRRAFHRIVGTFVGVGLCWGIMSLNTDPKMLCLSIVILQFIVEMLVLRHYALAVVFITALTTLLSEATDPSISNLNALMLARLLDISIGSVLGLLGGWFIYNNFFSKVSKE